MVATDLHPGSGSRPVLGRRHQPVLDVVGRCGMGGDVRSKIGIDDVGTRVGHRVNVPPQPEPSVRRHIWVSNQLVGPITNNEWASSPSRTDVRSALASETHPDVGFVRPDEPLT